MGLIRVTSRPYYYAQLEAQKQEEPEEQEEWQNGTVSFRMSVGGLKGMPTAQQNELKRIVSSVLKQKGHFVRERIGEGYVGSRGYYDWGKITIDHNLISTGQYDITDIGSVLELVKRLDEEGLYPEDVIIITYHPAETNLPLLFNLHNIIESRRPLIEEALSLEEPFLMITARYGFALGIKPSVFSYTAVEASAYLIEQACKMAETTGKSRMKPCDMKNPRFQMRSWLLRLGFIGEQFERPRRTLLEGLPGDSAFFSEDKKNQAVARRKAKSMNGGKKSESAQG